MSTDRKSLDQALAALTADPNAYAWPKRAEFAREAAAVLGGGASAAAQPALTIMRLLASDSKWEVRKDVADALHVLPDSEFAPLAAQLVMDENAFVKASADRALERRRRSQSTDTKRRRGLDKVEDDLARLQKVHGSGVAGLTRDIAQRLYEGLVGASVHEMRSVATAMKAAVEQLARNGMQPTQVEKLSLRLGTHVGYLERLLDDMRLYTQAPSNQRRTERIADLVTEASHMVREEFEARNRDAGKVTLQVEIPSVLTAAVSRVQIILALRNLIKNAFEAHVIDAQRFAAGSVRVRAQQKGEYVEIEVADDGPGFPKDELKEVSRFVPGRTSKHFLGTGFGLPIARRNVVAHGGTLDIESTENVGTRIIVRLPIEGREELAW